MGATGERQNIDGSDHGATDERQNIDGSDHEDDKSDDELLEQVRKIHLYISEKFNYYQ